MSVAEHIWSGIKLGDVNALKELYQLLHQELFQYGKKMTGSDVLVEDAIQETFVSIWKYRETVAEPPVVKYYVLKVFRNQLVQLIKQQQKTTLTSEDVNFAFEVSIDHALIRAEEIQEISAGLSKALAQLTNRQRELIYYRFYENLSFEEIAAIMNMQTRATYKLAARALAALKEIYGAAAINMLILLLK